MTNGSGVRTPEPPHNRKQESMETVHDTDDNVEERIFTHATDAMSHALEIAHRTRFNRQL